MSKRIKSTIALALLLAIVVGLIPPIPVSAASDTSAVGEIVDSYTANNSTFTLSENSRIFVVADTEPTGELLQTVQLIQRQFAADGRPSSTPMQIAWGPASWITDGDIVVRLNPSSGIAAEGYELAVTTTAEVTVSDVDGLIYGANMLLKHLRYADSNSIQGFAASDAPDTAQRAVSLDCGRKYYTKNWICNFIREMSWMGYNTLEMHFSDDSGFRVDLWDPDYYKGDFQPANDFSWVCGSNYTSWTLSTYKNDVDQGKYLTTEEVIEILNTAKEYHIDVIPAFDSPSHLDYVNWTFEQNYNSNPDYSFYSTYDQKTYYAADVDGIVNYTNSSGWSTPLKWPYYSTIDINGAQAKAFIFELYIDIANFFKEYAGSTDFSIGADEVNLNTANLASGYSFTWSFPDFVDYINELNALLNGKGYTMRMYNDFMGSTTYNASSYDFADNIEILYWDSPFEPTTGGAGTKTEPASYFVNKGQILYNCIQTHTYYALRITKNNWNGSDARSIYNRQWTFYHSNEEDIYNEWVPNNVGEIGDYAETVPDIPDANLGGAYFLIWCDYNCVSTEQEIWNGCYDKTTSNTGEFYSLRDRMWSNITKMWNWDANETLAFEDFVTIRDAYGNFPGCGTTETACSEKTVLPTATEPVSGYAGGCAEYASYCQVAVTAASAVMTLPCASTVEATSSAMEMVYAGDTYTAIRLYQNTVGELWYKVQTKGGLVGYIKAADTRYVTDVVDDITISGAAYPSGHVVGSYFLVRGDIAARYNTLTSVAVYIHDGFGVDGDILTGDSATVTDNYYSLLNSTIDNNTSFGDIPAGEHTYAISADYRSYHVSDGVAVAGTGKVYLMEKCFIALASSVDQTSCSHSYSKTVLHEATCTTEGTMVYACATCGHVYEEKITNGGHSYTSETIAATCMDYEKIRYTCSDCGDSYEAYPEHIKTQWQTTKPEGVDERLIEVKQQYRYADLETTTSYETSLDGYTQAGSTWVAASTGSVEYVNTWPSGFSTSSSLYAQYNNKDYKVTADETETTKRVIDSDQVTGYLYYHWCYYGSYYSRAYRSGSYTTFHAYYSTTAPGNYVCDTSDMSYKTSHTSTCTNSNWYFVANVYTQSYTDYNKLYTYERWGEWSDWSDTVYTAGTTRKVESQPLYRYVDGEYASHTWKNGICTLCGDYCRHTYQNNVCTSCGEAKLIQDMYLFGYINGADYADKDDSENLGEYKFVNGSLTVEFTQDSYVGIKSADNLNWYKTDGWQGYVSSVTLYNASAGAITNGDKLFIPGNTEIVFTLVDNGDDTYTLSYIAVVCPHESHTTDGVCTQCGDPVEHSYGTSGFCVCGLECQHIMVDGVCTICGKECDHIYQNNVCTVCGQSKPVYDYYLFGYINNANYACEEDYANLGEYKFVDGQVVVRFTSDSYVAVKASDNQHWYMTAGWQGKVSSATLYNTKTLSNADKLYVPGGTEVTFTLVDNGDDTYVLSYKATCTHPSHDQTGVCASCGETVLHSYQNNVCTICGYEKPVLDLYLFGYINGADYACEADYANLGIYKFVDGKLVVYFTADSYVGVKASDNLNWYMTDGYLGQVTSATLVNAETILTEDKLFIPGNMKITFTLVDNGDDTYVLSYVAVECPHDEHDTDGVCTLCGSTVEHIYTNGICACGLACSHNYKDGICAVCGMACVHSWTEGVCDVCGVSCVHSWMNGVCDICGVACAHSWVEGECSTCGIACEHSWTDGRCQICGVACTHSYQNNICTVCGLAKPEVDYYLCGIINGTDYAWGADAVNLGEYKFVDGKLVVTFRQEGYISVKASNNAGWYMTDGDQGTATSVMLYNTAAISTGAQLWIPGCMEITFTLVDNGDDTLTLSYTAVDCAHAEHNTSGECTKCGTVVGHSYKSVTTDPTCTEAGSTVYTCACGDSYSEEIPALGHSYESVVTAPTCTDAGYTTHTCTVCGDTYTDSEVAATGHDYKSVTTDPTCTETGSTVYTCACGDSYSEEIPALGHSYESVVTAPTCTEAGYTTHTCTVCGDTYTDSEVAATGHDYKSVTTDPTCTEAGSTVYTCACGDSYSEEIPALGHKYESVVTAPTCTEAGYTTHTCTVCGDTYTDSEVAATGHDYKSVTTDPTCTETGSTVYTCACGDSYSEEIPALGHKYESVVTAPTCTEAGYTTHTCAVCGDSYTDSEVAATGHDYESVTTDPTCTEAGSTVYTCACGDSYSEEIPALGHSYESVVTAPTCTEAGYTTHTCTVCDHSYTDSEVAATGHDYKSVTTDPTCTEAGSTVYTCACGDSYSEEIPALGHSYESVVTAPTCTEAGFTTHTCTVCDHSYTDSEVAATGHDYKSVTTDPTCTEAGSTVYTCACGDSYTETIAALGHSYESVVTAPTCTEAGYTTHTCTVCGDTYTDSEVAATGHDYKSVTTDPTCTEAGSTVYTCACGDSYSEEIPALGHSYESVVTAPTCTEVGFTTHTCTVCDHSYTDSEVAATGHNYKSVTTDPTCTEAGSTVYTCTCGDSYSEEIPALGHSYESVVTAPTCTEAGYTTHTCTVCGDSYTDSEVAATGHDYKSVTTDPTCTEAGSTVYTCACGDSYSEEIPALGHSYESVVTAPACTEAGYTTHTCTVCGDSYKDSEVAATGHDYKSVTTDPTCTEAGSTVYTCACGDSYTETIAATGHNWANGTCTVCGAVEPVEPALSPIEATLALDGEVKYNIFFKVGDMSKVKQMGLITFETMPANGTINNADYIIPGYEYSTEKGAYKVQSQGVPAKKLGDTLYMRIYAELEDGSVVYSRLMNYSARKYGYNTLKNHADKPDLVNLVVAMLNYGAAAQEYFGYNTDNLINDQLTDAQKATQTAYSSTLLAERISADSSKTTAFPRSNKFTSYSATMVLEGAFAINYHMTPSLTPDNGMRLYYWSEEKYQSVSALTVDNADGCLEMELNGSTYSVAYAGLAAKEVDDTVYAVAVYESNGVTYTSGVMAYSLAQYCRNAVEDQSTAADLCEATSLYCYYAKIYFNET